jgi:hypothetical protein
MGMITFAEIFHSSRSALRQIDYGNIGNWMKNDWIKAREVILGDTPLVKELLLPENELKSQRILLERHGICLINGGSAVHRQLCRVAAAYLLDLNKKPITEQRYNGKRVDLISDDKKWIIECGDTDAKPILEHLYNTCQYFAVYPFGSKSLYVFERGTKWDNEAIKRLFSTPANEGVKLE